MTILIISIVISVLYLTTTKNVGATETAQCSIDAPVGCDEIIADLQNEYKELQRQQELLSKKADAYRAIARLGTGEIQDEKLK